MLGCKQPNPWTCYPTCVAYLIGEPIDKIIELIGHDGSKIVNENPEPLNREQFTYFEMYWALLQLGWCLGIMDLREQRTNWSQEIGYYDDRLPHNVNCVISVINGNGLWHALAWDRKKNQILDPLTGEKAIIKDTIASIEPLIKSSHKNFS